MNNRIRVGCVNDYLNAEFSVRIATDLLPFDEFPFYSDFCFCGLCTSGSADIEVFSVHKTIKRGDLVVLFPNQLVSSNKRSEDFTMTYFCVSTQFFRDIVSGICRMTADFFFFMRVNFVYSTTEEQILDFITYCETMRRKAANNPASIYNRESVMCWLRIIFWELFVNYKESERKVEHKISYNRQDELALNFFNLLAENYKHKRDVAFYADKMCISPKYLTMSVKEACGKSAKEIIIEYTLLEIKALLRDPSLDIKDIVTRTNFPSQSIMSRFFRKHEGQSPTEYRLKIGR